MEFMTAFGPRVRVQVEPVGETKAQQHMKDECDVNFILAKYKRTGLITHVKRHAGQYGDFLSVPDYHTAMNEVIKANDMFAELPAEIRKMFGNDPAAFLDFVHNPDNEEKMREIGLLPSKQPAAETPAEVPAEPAPPAPADGA